MTLQIRSMPDHLHRALKVRAAQEGVSMSEWVTARIAEALDRPSRPDLLARIEAHAPSDLDPTAALRDERDRPDRALAAAPAPGWGESGGR